MKSQNYVQKKFTHEIAGLMQNSDLVISRSGSGTISGPPGVGISVMDIGAEGSFGFQSTSRLSGNRTILGKVFSHPLRTWKEFRIPQRTTLGSTNSERVKSTKRAPQ